MSLLNAADPDIVEALQLLGVDLLWHPSLSGPGGLPELLAQLESGARTLDVLCIEGAILRGPGGTGMYDSLLGRPKMEVVASLARKAQFVVAIGTCAAFGGISAACDAEATGLQYSGEQRGGFLGGDFVSRAGLPVINLAGCPAHCDVVTGSLGALARGQIPALDAYQRPIAWYGLMVHQGCTRNEYHEFRAEEWDFGKRGCLFFHLGCQGPLSQGPCNKLLWNGRSSKTRVGVPCHGCTRPDFPRPYAFFKTRNIEGIPLDLPDGVKRAHYMVYKNMAKVAMPERLRERITRV